MQGRGAHMVVSAAPKNIAKQSANEKHESRMTLRRPRGDLRVHTLDSRKRRNQIVPMRDTSCPRTVPLEQQDSVGHTGMEGKTSRMNEVPSCQM
jgi:hypothetical protein